MENRAGKFAKIWHQWGARSFCVALIDVFLLAAAVYISYALRLSIFLENAGDFGILAVGTSYVAAVMLSFVLWGVYKVYWLQTSVEEMLLLLKAYVSAFLVLLAFYFLYPRSFIVPRSVIALLFLSGFSLLAAVRLTWRLDSSRTERHNDKKVLIIGAGSAGVQIARDMIRNNEEQNVVGFLDDDPAKKGKNVAGVPVLGKLSELPQLIKKYKVDTVLVALPSAPVSRVRDFLNAAVPLDVTVRILPSLHELADGRVTLSSLRPVKLEDLLGREPVRLDAGQIGGLLAGKCVMVTGAGGSIGSEIVRQMLPYKPRSLILLGHGEYSIYTLLEELALRKTDIQIIPVIADVADVRAMTEVFMKYKPEIVFHAAAHKHVPLMESNAREAVRVNCLGTWTVGHLAGEFGVSRLVLISTDKAVNPSSIMGASKRIAEMTLMDLQRQYSRTSYLAVRFGNVLGSRGSVIPKFERQIAAGGPVTVTHPQMVRYFMLIPEAAGLVLQTAAIGVSGRIYVLDMGTPVKITSLAETLIRLNGYEPGRDIKIEYTGIRPGEKLFEELFYDKSHVDETSHPKIFCAKITENTHDETQNMYDKISAILQSGNPAAQIAKFVHEYHPAPGK